MAAGVSRSISGRRPTTQPCARWPRRPPGRAAARALRFEQVAAKDWVAESLAGLKPVSAGRFIVHGAHDRARFPSTASASRSRRRWPSAPAITAPRAAACSRSTGCANQARQRVALRASSISAPASASLPSPRRARCGSACWRPISMPWRCAPRAPMRGSTAPARWSRSIKADGVTARALRERAPFDLIFANILLAAAAALRRAADETHRAAAAMSCCPACCASQANAAIAAYPRLALERRIDSTAGRTLVLGARRARRQALPPTPVNPLLTRSFRKPVSTFRIMPRLPAMFEAHFQSFEDRSERAESAPRVAALRAELAKRGLDGFIVPRADRFQNEYVPPCDERLAWLTGFTGSAGAAIVLADRAVIFVDGRYQVQVREEVDSAVFTIEHLVERPPTLWIEDQSAGRRQARLFAVAAYGRRRRAARQGLRRGATPRWCRSKTIRSTPSGPTGRSRRSARWCRTICAMPAKTPRPKLARVRAEMQKLVADTLVVSDPHAVSWLFNIRGSDVPHTPVVLAFAIVPKEGRPALYVDLRKLGNEMRASLEEIADVRPNAAFERDLAELGKERTRAAARSVGLRRGDRAARRRERRHDRARQRPDCADESDQERHRDRRRPRGAAARRRGGDAIPRLVRSRSAARRTDRDRRGRGAGKLSPRHRAAQGRVVPDHRRRRPERRHRALSRHPQEQPPHRAGRTVPDRFRRPIRGRHHRHHAHRRGRHAVRRHAQELHPRAQGPYRHRPRGVSRRHHRRAARYACAAISVAGRPRFRSRHRPRRRQLSVGARRTGAHLQARQRIRSSAA